MLYPILEQYDVDIKKALAYGFVREGAGLTLRKPLPETEFYAVVTLAGKALSVNVLERDTDEEYLPFNVADNISGYVMSVREKAEALLEEIKMQCLIKSNVKLQLMDYCSQRFGTVPDAPWPETPENFTFKTALSIGADTFQFFTRNPRGGKAKAVKPEDAAALNALMQGHNFAPILAHAPYTMNPCAADEKLLEFAHMVMEGDLAMLEYVPGNMYNFHPGSHVKQGAEVGIEKIAALLNSVLHKDLHTTVLLETMAGKGTEVGRNFEELAAILSKVQLNEKMGVCLDTCHIFDGGYDIVNDLDGVLAQFDKIIGLERLKAVHLNDSLNICGSHKDRHACIGAGNIGLEALTAVINHPALRTLPFYLETPNELPGYAAEIKLLRERFKE